MLKFVGGHVFFRRIYGGDKKSANPDIRRRLGRLTAMLTLNTIAGIDRLAVKGYCTSLDYSYPRHTSASNFQVDALSKKLLQLWNSRWRPRCPLCAYIKNNTHTVWVKDFCGPKELVLDEVPDSRRQGIFCGGGDMCSIIATYLCGRMQCIPQRVVTDVGRRCGLRTDCLGQLLVSVTHETCF